MPPAYQIRVYSTDGELQAVVDRFRTLAIEHRVNYPSTLTLSLYGLDPTVPYFTLDSLVEVRRRVPEANLDWYTEYVGFHRTPQKQITSANNRIFTSYSRGLLDLIKRRSIRYYSDTAGSAKGPAPADDVIKDYVRENAGSLATLANGRVDQDGTTQGLAVAADLSAAASYEGAHAWENLLDAIRNIGEPNLVDSDVVLTSHEPATFEFRTYYPQLGTDKRTGTANPFVFAPHLGNMSSPSHTQSRTDEITSVLVLGPGEDTLRDTTLRNSSHVTDSPWNLIELDQNASNEDRAAALTAIGDQVLFDKRPAVNFTFDVIQTPDATYHEHYQLGDLVTARYDSDTPVVDVKIVAVTLTVERGHEVVKLELKEVD